MGVDYIVKSKANPALFEGSSDAYLKYALRDIAWGDILNLLRINLGLLYDSRISYWAPEQVHDMYESVKLLYTEPSEVLYEEEDIVKANMLRADTKKLLDYFQMLVDNEAYIHVY